PGRQPQIEGQNIVGAGAEDFVEQGPGLNRDDEEKNERCEYVDEALQFRSNIRIDEVDRNVSAPIRRRGNPPEDQNAEKKPPEVVTVRNLHAEEISQQHRSEDIGGDDANEERRQELDAIDETIHPIAAAASGRSLRWQLRIGHDRTSLTRRCRLRECARVGGEFKRRLRRTASTRALLQLLFA